jgi:hypothetical protein
VIANSGELPLFALLHPERFRVAFRIDQRIIHIGAWFIRVRSNRIRIRILGIRITRWQGRKLGLRHLFSPPIVLHGEGHPAVKGWAIEYRTISRMEGRSG